MLPENIDATRTLMAVVRSFAAAWTPTHGELILQPTTSYALPMVWHLQFDRALPLRIALWYNSDQLWAAFGVVPPRRVIVVGAYEARWNGRAWAGPIWRQYDAAIAKAVRCSQVFVAKRQKHRRNQAKGALAVERRRHAEAKLR